MLPNLLHSPLAFFQFDTRFMSVMLIPIVGLVVGAVIAVFAMHFHNVRRQMWHETARVALEKGQPIPPMADEPKLDQRAASAAGRNDIRTGFILIGVGAGLYIFFDMIGASPMSGVGAIPGLIGVALLVYAFLSYLFFRRNSDPSARPPQS